ncbi:MAG: hypothetical protein KKB51_22980 [Candidatus Riflebacteria bacterium]|nr:hypothetical protein [Candidatus Riflebacteria bacterium]
MKRLFNTTIILLIFTMFFSTTSFSATTGWEPILAQNPQNQTALFAMAKTLNVPPELVNTKLYVNRLSRDFRTTFASEETFYELVACYEALGEFENARKAIAGYISAHPQIARPLLSMAYDYYLEGNYQYALAWYDRAIAQFPGELDAFHGKMLTLIALVQYDQALKIGMYILSVSPNNYFATLRVANILYARKDFHNAFKYYSIFYDKIDNQLGMGLCFFNLSGFSQAAPLLRAVASYYPQNQELLAALKHINRLEIAGLLQQLSTGQLQFRQSVEVGQRVAELYELNGEFEKAADLLWQIVSRPPLLKELLRIAADYAAAGKYQKAGNTYLKAIPISTDSWATSLAAANSFLLAGDTSQARNILLKLQEQNRTNELWPYLGRLYFQMKDVVQGKKYFNLEGAGSEKLAGTMIDSRATYIYAVDCYLNAGNYSRAKTILDHINSFAPGIDLDRKYIRYFSEQKDFSAAISLCSKFPGDPLVQNSKGWAYVGLGDIRSAEKTFRNVLRLYPQNVGAKAGLDYTDKHQPWEFFLGYTGTDYNSFQDDRGLITNTLRYSYKKTTSTLSYTRTDVNNLSAGATDFNENLFGGKVYYQARHNLGLQLHLLKFYNDDAATDGSTVVGGKVFCYPDSSWLVGAGLDFSRYNSYKGFQLSPFVGYQFNKRFRADLKALFTSSSGRMMRASQSSSAGGGVIKATYTPNDRFMLSLGGLFGKRRLGVDGENLFAYNTLDLYKNGGFAKILYTFNGRWKAYLGYSVDQFSSETRSAANEKAGVMLADPDQTSKRLTTGVMFQF